jgi:hypothetical protein
MLIVPNDILVDLLKLSSTDDYFYLSRCDRRFYKFFD